MSISTVAVLICARVAWLSRPGRLLRGVGTVVIRNDTGEAITNLRFRGKVRNRINEYTCEYIAPGNEREYRANTSDWVVNTLTYNAASRIYQDDGDANVTPGDILYIRLTAGGKVLWEFR